MSRSTSNMLRTRRRDNNVKPNRRGTTACRLDRKSSRGMIYENEELRLRTININAEIERGQYDIKKLKRENEMLKKEIWCLRDEYDKLDKLLKEKEYDFSSSSTTCTSSDSESCSSCTEESEEVETSQNLQNVQKTNMKNLHAEFDLLSVVPEENSTENSDKNSNRTSIPNDQWNSDNIIKPDQSYPPYDKASTLPTLPPRNFFSPIKVSKSCDEQFYSTDKVVTNNATNIYQNMVLAPKPEEVSVMGKTSTDLIVKTDNRAFNNNTSSRSTFSNGGNLEELLNDIETISQDILKITNDQANLDANQPQKPYKSELNVVLMPNPMPLLGFDKYRNIHNSFDSLHSKSAERLPIPEDTANLIPPPLTTLPLNSTPLSATPCERNPFYFGPISDTSSEFFNSRYNLETPDKPPNLGGSKSNLLDLTSSELISSENEENLKFQTTKLDLPKSDKVEEEKKSPKMSIRRKVSIHFKGKRDKAAKPADKKSFFDIRFGEPKHQKTPSVESRKSTTDAEAKTPTSSDSKTGSERRKTEEKKQRKSSSVSPDRKHVHVKDEKKHKKHRKSDRMKSRRGTITSMDRIHRERSYSVCTDRSNALDHRFYDDYGMHSERERTNSLSSCETVKTRKMSNISNIPLNGKVPWCACWGNGCI